MSIHHPGILIKHQIQKDKPTNVQLIKGLAQACGKSIFPEVVMPRIKRPYKERPNARKPHQQHEKTLQKDIVHYLRLKGCTAGRIKTSGTYFQGRYLKDETLFVGVPDILCFAPSGQWWIEVKWGQGGLSKEQELFKIYCLGSGINHIVARCVSDVERILA